MAMAAHHHKARKRTENAREAQVRTPASPPVYADATTAPIKGPNEAYRDW